MSRKIDNIGKLPGKSEIPDTEKRVKAGQGGSPRAAQSASDLGPPKPIYQRDIQVGNAPQPIYQTNVGAPSAPQPIYHGGFNQNTAVSDTFARAQDLLYTHGSLDELRAISKELSDVNRSLLLQSAVGLNSIEATRVCLESGADPFLKNNYGTCALDLLCEYTNHDLFECLVDFSTRKSEGKYKDYASFLNGYRTQNGSSMMELALERKDVDSIKSLIKQGAALSTFSRGGSTCFSLLYVCVQDQKDLEDILQLYKTQNPEDFRIAKSESDRVLLAHRFAFKERIEDPFEVQRRRLEGEFLGKTTLEISQSFNSFVNEKNGSVGGNIIEPLKEYRKNKFLSPGDLRSALLKQKENPQITIIPIGLNVREGGNHAVSVVLYGDCLCTCNRGSGIWHWQENGKMRCPGIELFRVPEGKLDLVAQLLTGAYFGDQESWDKLRYDGLDRLMNFTMASQSVGNCAWYSAKTALLGSLLMDKFASLPKDSGWNSDTGNQVRQEAFNEAKAVYDEWVFWDQKEAFKKAKDEVSDAGLLQRAKDKIERKQSKEA